MARQPSGFRHRGDRSYQERAYESVRRVIHESMGVDLHDLKTPVDPTFAPPIVARMASLPALKLRILLLSNATMKFQEQVLLSFFGRLSTMATDVLTVSGRERSLHPSLPQARYVDETVARRTEYDVVVGFDCGARLLEEVRRREVPGVLIGIPRGEVDRASSWQPLLRYPLLGYTTQWWSTSALCGLELGVGNVDVRSRILYPPNVPINRQTPADPAFDIVVPGGGDRDYEHLRRIADEIGAKRILVTSATDGRPHHLDPKNDAVEQLGGDERFVLVKWIPGYRYVDIVANARVVLVPLLGVAMGDLTCISDALWYGRPVLATQTGATEHLDGVVTFFEDPPDVARALARLSKREEYEAASARSRAHAREHHDFYKLLFDVFDGLRELEDSPQRKAPRPPVPEGWIGASREQVLAVIGNWRFRGERAATSQTQTEDGVLVRCRPQDESMFIRVESGPGACRLTVETWPVQREERRHLECWWEDICSELRVRTGAAAPSPPEALDASGPRPDEIPPADVGPAGSEAAEAGKGPADVIVDPEGVGNLLELNRKFQAMVSATGMHEELGTYQSMRSGTPRLLFRRSLQWPEHRVVRVVESEPNDESPTAFTWHWSVYGWSRAGLDGGDREAEGNRVGNAEQTLVFLKRFLLDADDWQSSLEDLPGPASS